MAERPERITEENVLSVDILSIAQDRRFAELKFENIRKKLPKVQSWLVEANDLGAQEFLNIDDQNALKNLKNNLIQHLEKLLTFEIRTTNDTASSEHQSLENQVDNFYNSAYHKLPKEILPFLRQETARSANDVQELEKQRKSALQAQRDYEVLKAQISKELEDIRARRSEVEREQGKFVAIGLGKDFGDQAESYQKNADEWLKKRNFWTKVLFSVIGSNLVGYFVLLFLNLLNSNYISPTQIFTLQYGLAKFALLLLLSYVIGFCSRNYNISSGLTATNRHRKNIAEVLLSALSSSLSEEAKGQMIGLASTEMFKHLPIGYINKEHQNDSGPIFDMVKRITS